MAEFLALVAAASGAYPDHETIVEIVMRLIDVVRTRTEQKQFSKGERAKDWRDGASVAVDESIEILTNLDAARLVSRAAAACRSWEDQVFREALDAVDALATWRLTHVAPDNRPEVHDEHGLRILDRIAREVPDGPLALQEIRRNVDARLRNARDPRMASALSDVIFLRVAASEVAVAHGYRPGGFNRILNTGAPRWDARVRAVVRDGQLLKWGARQRGGALFRALRTLCRPTEDELVAVGAERLIEFVVHEEVDARSGAWTAGSWLRLAERLGRAQPQVHPRVDPAVVRALVETDVRAAVALVLARR